MQSERIQRIARDERLARHAGFWWGFAEGLFFFIVPDVYISFAVLFSLRTGGIAWLFSIAGSVAAVLVIYVLAVGLGLDYLSFLRVIPDSGPLIERAREALATEGLPYTPLLALRGVPLKVYAALAFSLGLSLGPVLLWTIFARIVRIAPTFAVAATIRLLFRRQIDARATTWFVLLGFFWFVFYIFHFIRMSRI